MAGEKHVLSKTSFLKAVQCPKAFFLYKFHYNQKDPLSNEKIRLFKRGHDIGHLAQSLFPNGIDASPAKISNFHKSVLYTRELINQGQNVIYEAAFIAEDTLVAIDLLVKENSGWHAYEVKSALKIRQTYVMDAALQYYVIKKALPDLSDISLVCINEKYKKETDFSLTNFFRIVSVRNDAIQNEEYIRFHIQRAKSIFLEQKLPSVSTGSHCFHPHECDFMQTCWKNSSNQSIYKFKGFNSLQADEWNRKGISLVQDIPPSELTPDQIIMVDAQKHNQPHINHKKLDAWRTSITYPIAFLDAEFFAPAVPKFSGDTPFKPHPFLFSLKKLEKPGADIQEITFFHEANSNPDHSFTETLLSETESVNSLILFDASQELKILNQITAQFPQFQKKVNALRNKVSDLAQIFNSLSYYHPAQNGNFSLKKCHLAVTGINHYKNLNVPSGILASYLYEDYLSEMKPENKQSLTEDLIQYCQTDTLCILELFLKVTGGII